MDLLREQKKSLMSASNGVTGTTLVDSRLSLLLLHLLFWIHTLLIDTVLRPRFPSA